MIKYLIPFTFFLLISCSQKEKMPPLAPSKMVIDNYHGQEIEDPYRNLENLRDTNVIGWLKEQSIYAKNIIESIPGRQDLIDKQIKYSKLSKYDIENVKVDSLGKYFYLKTESNEDFSKLYSKIESKEKLLFNPKTLPEFSDYQIESFKPDWNSEKIAIGLSKKGEENSLIIILDIKNETVLPFRINNASTRIGGIHWLSDNSGFIYLSLPTVDPTDKNYLLNTSSQLFLLDKGTSKEVFSKEKSENLDLKKEDIPYIRNYNSKDGFLYGVVGGVSAFKDIYFIKESEILNNKINWQKLCSKSDKIKKIRVFQDSLIFLTSRNDSNFEIARVSINDKDYENAEILVKSKESEIINDFAITIDGIVYTTIKNGVQAKLYHKSKLSDKEINLPYPSGTIDIDEYSSNEKVLRITTGGHLNPDIDYLFNAENVSFIEENIKAKIDLSDFQNLIVEEIEIKSHDGVMVPVSIIRNKKITLNGQNPTLFFGYGAYGVSGGAYFNPSFLTWVTEGGILVFAYVRGGGQKGDDWHKGGFKTTKPNTWKDMIACTEYLIEKKYTSAGKTALWGSSAGGILAGRAMTERPDLYNAVILTSPSLNMLRSEEQPNGLNSVKEFGSVKFKDEFEALLEMDAYHHIEKNTNYPATFVTGGMKDGRVVVWDHAKFVAKLQAYNISDNPILFLVDFEDGHAGMNNSRNEIFKKYADAFSFAFWNTGHPKFQYSEN